MRVGQHYYSTPTLPKDESLWSLCYLEPLLFILISFLRIRWNSSITELPNRRSMTDIPLYLKMVEFLLDLVSCDRFFLDDFSFLWFSASRVQSNSIWLHLDKWTFFLIPHYSFSVQIIHLLNIFFFLLLFLSLDVNLNAEFGVLILLRETQKKVFFLILFMLHSTIACNMHLSLSLSLS